MLNPIQRYFPKLHRLFSTSLEEADFERVLPHEPELTLYPVEPLPKSTRNVTSNPSNSNPGNSKPSNSEPSDRDSGSCGHSGNQTTPSIFLPLDLPELLNRGHNLLAQGQLEEAIAHYRHVVQLAPTAGEVYQYLAEALSQQGELKESAACYRKAIELSTANGIQKTSPVKLAALPNAFSHAEEDEELSWFEEAAFCLQQGDVLCNLGNWTEAIAASEQAIDLLEPQLATAYITAGRAWQHQDNLEMAEQVYEKAIAIQPQSAAAHARLASLYAQQQCFTQAIAYYQQAIALDPQFAGAYWKLADLWNQLGEPDKAATHWYQALQLQPTWAKPPEYVKLGNRLREQGKLDWAIACYQQAIRGDATLSASYHYLGETLGQQGDWVSAADAHRQAVVQDAQNAQFHAGLGQALMALEQWQEAALCYRQVTQLAPDQVLGYLGLRDALVKQDCWLEALPCYQKLVELQPSGKTYHELGDAYSQTQHWTEAIAAFQHAIPLQPEFFWSYNNLGYALLQLDQWQAAATAFQQAIGIHSGFHWTHYNLGEALANLADWDGAIAAYQQALNLQPEMLYAQQKLAHALQQRAKADQVKALDYYRQAIRQDPDNLQNYHKALEIQPNDAELYIHLADALVRQNNSSGAIAFYQIAQQLQAKQEIGDATQAFTKNQPSQLQLITLGSAELYDYWLQNHTPTSEDLRLMAASVASFKYQPTISIVMPVYNPPPEFLMEAIESVIHQVYPHWELCIADDASTDPEVRTVLQRYLEKDSRIKVAFRTENGHISAASNSALALASGDYISLLDHDDAITPDALYEVVKLLNQHPEADMIYSDEDKLNDQGKRVDPFFKPDWCPDSFLSRMYTCHFGTYRRSIVEKIQGFRLGYEGAQDYDFVLRFTEHTKEIFHITKILYHWRIHAASAASGPNAKPYAYTAGKRAIQDAIHRRGEPGRVEDHPRFTGFYNVRYQIQDYKRVSIIIPTRNLGKVLNRCLESIFLRSTYPNYEVILIDNGSDEPETLNVLKTWQKRQPDRFKCYRLDIPFNYSQINNYAVTQATGDYLLFLNNDTEVIASDWIEGMVEQAQRSTIGAVGSRLIYSDEKIQHAGVVMGLGGSAGHAFYHFPSDNPGYFGQLITVNNYSAVTAACLMCRRTVFEQIGGFDEQLAVAYNDVDLCLKMAEQGYYNVYLPHVLLYHHESKSRGHENTPEKQSRLQREANILEQRWSNFIQHDPCYNPNLTRERADYSLSISLDLEVTEIDQVQPKDGKLLGLAIDSPQVNSQIFSKWVVISGWVVGQKSRAIAVEVTTDQLLSQSIPVNLSRPDVAKVYATEENAEVSGFSAVFDLSDLSLPAQLCLEAVLEDGDRVLLGTVQLQKK